MSRFILLKTFFILCLFCGCSKPTLSVRMYPFDRNDLASCIVDTPDPLKEEPIFGQRLSITWYVPERQFIANATTLQIHVRFENDTEIVENIPLQSRWGSYLWSVVGNEFINRKGILSYHIALLSQEKVIAQSKHKFWVESIQID